MRAVIQKVLKASVKVDSRLVSGIGYGILALIGLHNDDTADDMEYIIRKILNLRIFNDDGGIMNLSVTEINGEVLLVSQFTLYGNAHKGNRPSYATAMKPDDASDFFQIFTERFKSSYPKTKTGIFGADMEVEIINTGPVTILIDSRKNF